MGLMQVKVGLVHILSRFSLELCQESPVPLKINKNAILLTPDGEVPLLFKKVI